MWVKTLIGSTGIALALFSLAAVAQQQQQDAATQRQQGTAEQQQQQTQRGAGGNRQAQADQEPVLLVLPVAVYPRGEQIAKGCWIRLYEGNNFTGRMLSVVGPADLPDVEGRVAVFGFDSAIVGPKARVTTYDGENYQDRTATLEPGKRYPDLGDTKLGLFKDIESMRVQCG